MTAARLARAVVVATALLALAACSSDVPPPGPRDSIGAPTATSTPEPSLTEPAVRDPAHSGDFYDAGSQADSALAQLEAEGRTEDAALIRTIAQQPVATWLGEWLGAGVTGEVERVTRGAAEADQIAVLVVYAIPGRDCGLYSAGGVAEDQYLGFVQRVADGIDPSSETWIVLEPDALAQLGDCDGQGDRAAVLSGAAAILDAAGASVFLDAGNSNWRSVEDTTARIETVGTEHFTGFATNTSNYNALANEQEWADQVADRTGLPYIVDTSRNGNGSNGEWCNPRGRALGPRPALYAGGQMLAAVWVKAPGESDGQCNGGPPAGQWWQEIALELARGA